MKLNTIPSEIVAGIAIYLSIISKLRLAVTDRRLRGIICDGSSLWKSIDFAGELNDRSDKNRPELSDDIIESFLNKSLTEKVRKSVRVIDLSRSGPGITAAVVKTILLACPNIRVITLKNCAKVDLSALAHHLDTLVLSYPTLYLPNFTDLQLRPDGRTAASIITFNKSSLDTIRRSLDLLKNRVRPPLTTSLFTPDQDLDGSPSIPKPYSPNSSPCDLEECRCMRYYAAYTTSCNKCGEHPTSHYSDWPSPPLCLVCQCFCDDCHTQYCARCVREHCESVRCLCRLKETAIMCYCDTCKPAHSCSVCDQMWCEDHLRRCTNCTTALCHSREDGRDCPSEKFMIFCQNAECRESLCFNCAGAKTASAGDPVLACGAGRAFGWRFCALSGTGVCGACFEGDPAAEKWEHLCDPLFDSQDFGFEENEETENDDVENEEAVVTGEAEDEETENDDVENEEAVVTDEAEDLGLMRGNEGWVGIAAGEGLEIEVAG